MKTALVLASLASFASANSIPGGYISSTGGTAYCNNSTGTAVDADGNPFSVTCSSSYSVSPNHIELDYKLSSKIGLAKVDPKNSFIILGQDRSWSDTIKVTAPFSSGYLVPVFRFGYRGTYTDPGSKTPFGGILYFQDGSTSYPIDLFDWLSNPSIFNPLIPFTSGQTSDFTWGVCEDHGCFFQFTASDVYPGAFNTNIGGGIYADLLGFKVLNFKMQPYDGKVDFFSPTLPGIAPEPSTIALCVGGIGLLILLKARQRSGRNSPATQI